MNGASDSRPVAAIGAPGGQRPLYSAVVALRRRPSEDANDPVDLPPAVPDEVIRVLSVLPSASIVTAPNGDVLRASARALSLGLVNRNSLAVPDVSRLVARVADDNEAREQEMRVRRPPLGRELLELRVRVAPLGTGVLLILVDDLAEERRVDAVRRDFVANVSHELKTPVGALSLLAETVLSAADDPEQVRHFAERMQTEASRLASLIQDVIDLSRLQGDDPMIRAAAVDLDELITSAFDEVRTLAASRDIELVRSGEADSELYGDRGQLLTAVRNLLSNAVAYSPPGTRVSVSCSLSPGCGRDCRQGSRDRDSWPRSGPDLRALLSSRPSPIAQYGGHGVGSVHRQARMSEPRRRMHRLVRGGNWIDVYSSTPRLRPSHGYAAAGP